MAKILKNSAVRAIVQGEDKRCSKDFIEALDQTIVDVIRLLARKHNDGKKTLHRDILSAFPIVVGSTDSTIS